MFNNGVIIIIMTNSLGNQIVQRDHEVLCIVKIKTNSFLLFPFGFRVFLKVIVVNYSQTSIVFDAIICINNSFGHS